MTIKFDGKEYPARMILLDMEDYTSPLIVSVDILDVALMTEEGDYVSSKARAIDESIFFYVPDNKIGLNGKKLVQYVKEEISA